MPERYLTLGFKLFGRRVNRQGWIDRVYISGSVITYPLAVPFWSNEKFDA